MSQGESSSVKARSPKTGNTWKPLPTASHARCHFYFARVRACKCEVSAAPDVPQCGRGAGITLRTTFGTMRAAIIEGHAGSSGRSECTERTEDKGEKAAATRRSSTSRPSVCAPRPITVCWEIPPCGVFAATTVAHSRRVYTSAAKDPRTCHELISLVSYCLLRLGLRGAEERRRRRSE